MAEKIELPQDEKIEKAKEALKASFWGDFLFGGLVVSGLFIFIESLELPSSVNSSIGISLLIFALFLIFSRLIYFRISPYRIGTVIKKAENYRSEGEYEESLKLLNKLLEDKRNLKIKEIWYNKAKVFFNLARYEEALQSFNYALEINPFYKFANLGKGATLHILKRYQEALECIEKILALDQNDHKAWSNKGLTLRRLERYQEALECIDKALALDQNYKEAWYNKAWLESLQNNKDKALEYLRKAIGLDNKYKEMAKVGGDFNNIKDSQQFKELTEG